MTGVLKVKSKICGTDTGYPSRVFTRTRTRLTHKKPVPVSRVRVLTGTGTGRLRNTHGIPVQFTTYIAETEVHHFGFEQSSMCSKGCFPFISLLNSYIIVPPSKVDLGEYPSFT
ncbi:hypothetical protein K435DRAFT_692985 [Dendrothele bispora CBS 962.96]|uniref:Uncharacterized protein n=1 Tax=Dendrothele bispora (strain CBS 962.96) TaxID=1314807 RepID=A0A4S8L031_DENBC|nr:hypothetical protein K435DRAFT_692985 [Dendrothele bispora CBS 962.96]